MNKVNEEELNWKEKMASIDRQLAEHDRLRQEIRFEPVKVMIQGMAAGMGLLMIALTLLKFMGVITLN